jgi:hypothetical protein
MNWAMIQNVMKEIVYQYRIVNIFAALLFAAPTQRRVRSGVGVEGR